MVISKRKQKDIKVTRHCIAFGLELCLWPFLDKKECRCFITGLETKLMSGLSNSGAGVAVVMSVPKHRETKKRMRKISLKKNVR